MPVGITRINNFISQKHPNSIPGKMQSMYRLLKEKKSPWGLRLSLENFSAYDQIRVIPLYAVSNILK